MNPVKDSSVMYYTYVIRNDKGAWYTGSTGDLRKRIAFPTSNGMNPVRSFSVF